MKGILNKCTHLFPSDTGNESCAPGKAKNDQNRQKCNEEHLYVELAGKGRPGYSPENHRRNGDIINQSVCRAKKFRRNKPSRAGKPSENNDSKYRNDGGYNIYDFLPR